MNPYLVPGFNLHEELAHLVRAGFSPYEAIEAGTRHAAGALGKGDEFGTLREGMRADLLLVRDNPLDDAAHAAKREGVMLHGHWLPGARLHELLAGSAPPTHRRRSTGYGSCFPSCWVSR